jgi:hypothetical protein
LDGLDIIRNIGRQGGGLTPQQRANQADCAERDEHTHRHGGGPPQTNAPKHTNKGREDK